MLKLFLITILGLGSVALAKNNNSSEDTKSIAQKNLEKAMEKEKKYKKEEKFYMGKDYDLDSEKIGKDELKNVHTIPVDDLDMDEGVYSD